MRWTLEELPSQVQPTALEIKDLPQAVTMHSILVDLKFKDFSKSLAKRPAQTMIELLARSTKFINMEEVEATKRQADRPIQEDKGWSDKKDGKENRPPKFRFQNYMPLNTSIWRIMDDVKTVQLLSPPKRKNLVVKSPNAKKYCKYHRNCSHNTNKCITLKNEIKEVICKGHLS